MCLNRRLVKRHVDHIVDRHFHMTDSHDEEEEDIKDGGTLSSSPTEASSLPIVSPQVSVSSSPTNSPEVFETPSNTTPVRRYPARDRKPPVRYKPG